MDLPSARLGVVDFEGLTKRMALYMSMFLMGLQLPFCCPVHYILGFLGLALSHLLYSAWRTLLLCCIAWSLALEPTGEECPNLIACECFYTHGIRCQDGNQCSFHSQTNYRVARLESHFFHVKHWHKKFFFVSHVG